MKIIKKISEQFHESVVMRPTILITLGTLILLLLSMYLPTLTTLTVIFSCICFFALGEYYGFRRFKPKLEVKKESIRKIGLVMFIIALVSLYLDFFTAGGIPLFNTSLRRFLSPLYTSVAFLLVPASALLITTFAGEKYAKFKTAGIILFTAAMMALLGYRTEVLAALIVGALTAYYCEIFRGRELLLLALAALLAGAGMTYMRGGMAGIVENYRSATTLAAFDYLVEETDVFGMTHGYAQFADVVKFFSESPVLGGRNLVAMLVGGRPFVSMTSTLYGPPFVDFGVLAIVEFLIFGLIAGAGYKAAKEKKGVYSAAYAIVLTFLLLGIETGITDIIIWIYLAAAGVFFLYSHSKE